MAVTQMLNLGLNTLVQNQVFALPPQNVCSFQNSAPTGLPADALCLVERKCTANGLLARSLPFG